MQKKTTNGLTILELLVVIAVIGIFSVIAYPNITKWIADRGVKKDVYDVINYVNARKSEIQNGEYGMHQVALNTRVHTYSMSTKDFFDIYKKVGVSNYFRDNRVCRYQQPKTKQNTNRIPNLEIGSRNNDSDSNVYPSSNHSSPKNFSLICITKDGTIRHENNNPKNVNVRDPSTGKYYDYYMFCAKIYSTAKNCKEGAKHEIMYRITWDRYVNFKIYKYNKNKDTWKKIDG